MKRIFVLIFLFASFATYAAAPKKSAIEKGLPAQLINVARAEVIDLNREYMYMMACTLHPDICFDGIKEYKLEVRITSIQHGDLDFDCSLDQYTRKQELVIRLCSPVGHRISFKSLVKTQQPVITLKDK